MSLPSAVIDAMLAAGCSAEQLAAAVKAANEQDEVILAEKRAKAAAKKRRQRAGVPSCPGDIEGQRGTEGDKVSPKKESSPTPPKEKTTPSQSETNVSSKNPRQALETVLDQQRAGDVIEMRQRIRKPLTTRAAELLAGQLAKWHDPNEAADAMVLNGWQGFKPEYLQNTRARGSPSQPRQPKPDPFMDYARDLDEQVRNSRSDSSDWDDAQGLPVLTIDHHRRYG